MSVSTLLLSEVSGILDSVWASEVWTDFQYQEVKWMH